MRNKKTFLRNIITTCSVLAITLGTIDAMAARGANQTETHHQRATRERFAVALKKAQDDILKKAQTNQTIAADLEVVATKTEDRVEGEKLVARARKLTSEAEKLTVQAAKIENIRREDVANLEAAAEFKRKTTEKKKAAVAARKVMAVAEAACITEIVAEPVAPITSFVAVEPVKMTIVSSSPFVPTYTPTSAMIVDTTTSEFSNNIFKSSQEEIKSAIESIAKTTNESIEMATLFYNNSPDSMLDTDIAQTLSNVAPRHKSQHTTIAAVTHSATATLTSAITQVTARTSSLATSIIFSTPTTIVTPVEPNIPAISGVNIIDNNEIDTTNEASASGVAAGSSYDKFGAWAQIMGGSATQKARKDASGFQSNIVGSMIGVDTMVNDSAILGLALGNVINSVKQKDVQVGDKTRSSSWIFSGYGNYQFDNNWFIRGAAAYTKTAVDNKDLRTVGINKGIARGKYNIHSCGGEFIVGKALKRRNDLVIIPSIGVRFTHTGKISYQETGNTALNSKVAQDAHNTAHGVVGLQLMKSFVNNNDIILTSEAHTYVAYGLGVKTSKGIYLNQLSGAQAVVYHGNKPSRISSIIGLGVTAESGSIEYGLGYDANILAGYLGHQGSLKLKVKF